MSPKDNSYRKLAAADRLIVDGRERIRRQESRVVTRADRGPPTLRRECEVTAPSQAVGAFDDPVPRDDHQATHEMAELALSRESLRKMRRGILEREDWYSNLASSNRRIIEARQRIEKQKAHVRSLIEEGYVSDRAIALLRLFEETLRLMDVRRTNILKKVRPYRLPVCLQHGLRCVTHTKCDSVEPEH